MTFQMKEIQATETYPLRHTVLRPNQDISTCNYPGDKDPTTFHIGAFKGEELIGIASYYQEKHPNFNEESQYKLRGMATSENYRGMNIGKELIIKAEEILRERQVDFWWCNAREIAFGFYTKLGLSKYGKMFEIDPIGPHKIMFKHLKRRG